jgi:CRISPR-associated regulatory protein, Csa2 family
MFISFSLRVLIDAEALNMVESTGNYTKHRRAPLVVPVEGGFEIRYVPAISGESLAHAYQAILAELAEGRRLPVCEKCTTGEFLKHATDDVFGNSDWEKQVQSYAKNKDFHSAEKTLITNCVVEDVGGFLYTHGNVRRTSRVAFGYMLPARDFAEAAAVEPQFHVRHVPSQPERGKQMIYYVETGSALYVLSGYLDICGIGCTSMVKRECLGNADERRRVAVKALALMLSNQMYGGKRTRFLPAWTVASGVFAVSKSPFMVTPGHVRDYIDETIRRAKKYIQYFDSEVTIYYYLREGYEKPPIEGATQDKGGNEKMRVVKLEDIEELAQLSEWKCS